MYYAISLPTESSSREQENESFVTMVGITPFFYHYETNSVWPYIICIEHQPLALDLVVWLELPLENQHDVGGFI